MHFVANEKAMESLASEFSLSNSFLPQNPESDIQDIYQFCICCSVSMYNVSLPSILAHMEFLAKYYFNDYD